MTNAKQQSEASQKPATAIVPPLHEASAVERQAKAKEVSSLARETVVKQQKKAAEMAPERPQPESVQQQFEDLANANSENLNAMLQANEALFNGFSTIGQEMMDFANARLRQDFEVVQSLMGAKDMEEICRCQTKFAETASQQYLDEANKLINLMTKTTRECWNPFEAWRDKMARDFNRG